MTAALTETAYSLIFNKIYFILDLFVAEEQSEFKRWTLGARRSRIQWTSGIPRNTSTLERDYEQTI